MLQTPENMDVAPLLTEAKGVLRRYGEKLPNNSTLTTAVAAIDAVGAAKVLPNDPIVTTLRSEVGKAWVFGYGMNRTGSRGMTYLCVGISIMIMFLVGSLYVFYSQGTALLAEMETLSAKQPDRRFGQLERQLLVARAELFANPSETPTAACAEDEVNCPVPAANGREPIDELAHESSYALLHDLRDLNIALSSLEERNNEFLQLAASPVPGLAWLQSLFSDSGPSGANAATTPAPDADGEGQQKGSSSPAVNGEKTEPPKPPKSETYTFNHFCGRRPTGTGDPVPPDGLAYPHVLGMDMKVFSAQACDYSLRYTSMTVPSVNLWALNIKDVIAPYSAWVLPALFACLGAMIYFLRLMVDPNEPNPRINKIVHRVALAALAGIIVGWFWEPAFGTNSEFKAAGVGLFTFAFIIGFGIEIFFSLLDRFVSISTTAIAKLGGP